MSQEVSYTILEGGQAQNISPQDNFPMPGRRQLHIALAAAVLGVILAIVFGYLVFNQPVNSNPASKPSSEQNIKQHV